MSDAGSESGSELRAVWSKVPSEAIRNWQGSTQRIMRANERLMQGFMSAAKMEMQFGQEMLQQRFAAMQEFWAEPAAGKLPKAPDTAEIERLMTMMRAVSEEMHQSFNAAGRLLLEAATEQAANGKAMAEEIGAATSTDAQNAAIHLKTQAEGLIQKTQSAGQRMAKQAKEATKDAVAQMQNAEDTLPSEATPGDAAPEDDAVLRDPPPTAA